jgi:hypothetical protein
MRPNVVVVSPPRFDADLGVGIKSALRRRCVPTSGLVAGRSRTGCESGEARTLADSGAGGYVKNRETHRIDVGAARGPLVARVFERYATGDYSRKAITKLAFEMGLRHPRGDRRMTKSEVRRMLQRLVYTGEFMWMDKKYVGSHEPLITRETFDGVQAALRGRPPRQLVGHGIHDSRLGELELALR